MKVQAIRTDKGNFLANINGVFAYCNKDFTRIIRLTDEKEFAFAKCNWGSPVEDFDAKNLAWFLNHALVAPLVQDYKNALDSYYKRAYSVGTHNGEASSWGAWCGRGAVAENAGKDCIEIAQKIIDMQ
jgi:hypothetical protein